MRMQGMMTERGPAAALERERALEFVATIVEALPNPAFVKDEQHQWVLLNEEFCRLIDYDRAQLLGKSDYEFFPKEEADVFWAKDDLVFSTGEVVGTRSGSRTAPGGCTSSSRASRSTFPRRAAGSSSASSPTSPSASRSRKSSGSRASSSSSASRRGRPSSVG